MPLLGAPCRAHMQLCGYVQSWVERTSAYLKSQDPNHLVTVGEEGFYGPGSPDVDSNPSPGDDQ